MYLESDLVRIGKRENNKKRNYLVVNRLQGKHIPVLPSEALSMFDALAEIIEKEYSGEKLLLIGFAETATAIGAEAAIKLGAQYIQTTREIVQGVSYLFFRNPIVMQLSKNLSGKILINLLGELTVLYLLRMRLRQEIPY